MLSTMLSDYLPVAEVDDFHCKIFNRWGQVVFETKDHVEFWDGTYNKQAAPSDEYIYLINFEIGSQVFEETGRLTLIR